MQRGCALFYKTRKEVTFKEGKLVLQGVNPGDGVFHRSPRADWPGICKLGSSFRSGVRERDSFLKDNPNATLSVFSGDNVADLVVELSNPQLSGDDLTYNARILEGTPPANGGACALFIDIIGMPATPMSYAGAARRAWRR